MIIYHHHHHDGQMEHDFFPLHLFMQVKIEKIFYEFILEILDLRKCDNCFSNKFSSRCLFNPNCND
ncbi:hypothetical protein DERP_001861 [Dermatophagoides pteronyssinus]|uniref:Uncharacterized protein n=1 Tax=Dermatophagoides pteronyssinus TaxID=6956 RepID=A0ABQ8JC88_DERPT|nr:hypothetical protein DERP_001861 [Dermatophagoides pteronyssinus]